MKAFYENEFCASHGISFVLLAYWYIYKEGNWIICILACGSIRVSDYIKVLSGIFISEEYPQNTLYLRINQKHLYQKDLFLL